MKKFVFLLMLLIASLMMSAEQKASSSSVLRIPKALIGTKWTFENGYRAEKRTIEFISADKAKYTIEDINIWTTPDPPIIKTYDCYFNAKSNIVTIKRRSDMTIEFHWMQLRYRNGQLIECTNPNVEVIYEETR